MAKASDPRLAELTKKRPSSAPKPCELSDIPQIILSERKEAVSSLPSSMSSSVYSGAFCTGNAENFDKKETGGGTLGMGHRGHAHGMSVRSSSDIGLPASSMPNLAVSLVPGGDLGINENYLEVFCSPRTFRRSVDLDISSKDHNRSHFEWVDTMESSSNCLRVLTSSSRVGSALSLNSECTARSIGLLSNDSDSDNDLSLAESDKLSLKPAQLRRFMSYPEDSSSRDVCARPSQSMSDLKTMDNTGAATEQDSEAVISTPQTTTTTETQLEKSDFSQEGCKLEPSISAKLCDGDRPSSPHDIRLQEKKMRVHVKEICRDRSKGGTTRPSHMLSYKYDTHDSTRDCRIRQWLQDMDSQD